MITWVGFNISLKGADRLFSQNTMGLLWQQKPSRLKKILLMNKPKRIYLKNGSYDFEYIGTGDEMEFSKPVDCYKTTVLCNGILAKNKIFQCRNKLDSS